MDYKLPSNTYSRVFAAFAYSLIIEGVGTRNPIHGVICATLAGGATLVYAAVSPIFAHYFVSSSLWSNLLRRNIAVFTISTLSSSLGHSVNLINNVLAGSLFECVNHLKHPRPFNKTSATLILWAY